ncbi:MAG: hypothetical protein DHS20C18_00260 [Saprospiraceae bacterium]|nr:MAG: hypothetical protein DHS20C18_00260 [Saprospiraceae bacterium]
MPDSKSQNAQATLSHLSEYEFCKMKQKLEEAIQKADGNFEGFLKNKDYDFDQFVYRDLGICGGAYVFADAAKNQLVYLHNKSIQTGLAKEYNGIPFIEIPYNYYEYDQVFYGAHQEQIKEARKFHELLDAMYIGPRDRQPLKSPNLPSPEFYLNLPHLSSEDKLNKLLPFERHLSKNKFEVIYCTVGEVLFNLSTWRMLVRHAQLRGLNKPDSVINFDDEYVDYAYKYDFWEEVLKHSSLPETQWLKDMEIKKFSRFKLFPIWKEIKKFIDEDPVKSPEGYSSYDEYSRLGMVDSKGILTRDFLSLVRYAIHVAEVHLEWEAYNIDNYHLPLATVEKDRSKKVTSNEHVLSNLYILERRLDIYFQETESPHRDYIPYLDLVRTEYSIAECLNRVIRGYLSKMSTSKEKEKIVNLLTALHQQCRFPILPYFYELAAGEYHQPKEHLVFCIWHSNQNKIPLRLANGEEKEDSSVGFVLLTLSPIWRIDKKAHFIKDGRSIHCYKELSELAYCRLFRIYDFFRFLARPIIDTVFYSRLIKKAIERDYFRDYINAFSHELSKVTDNIFELSNLSIEELFKDKTDRVLSFAKTMIPEGLSVSNETLKKWRIIPFVDRFQTWSYTLRVWSGRRGRQVFDISEDATFHEILEKCMELSCQMRVGEFFLRAERVTSLKNIIEYDRTFRELYEHEKEKNKIHLEMPREIANLKLIKSDKDDIIFAQNALLRLLLAAITNILEHTTGDFHLKADWAPQKVEGSPCLRLVLVNSCEAREEKPKKSLGTKPVISTCLNFIKGDLENFGLFEDNSDTQNRKEFWVKKLKLDIKKDDLWETSFRFPIKNIFFEKT